MRARRYSAIAIALLLWCLTLGHVAAQSQPALPSGVAPVTSVEGINEYRLANGLDVLLVPDKASSTVTVNIVYKVGSRHESYGETGMAHLLEHLMFKGTLSHPNVPDELTRHGAQPNGTTDTDRTTYFETFTATDENLDWALSLEADRMVNSFIAKKDLDSEMTVVRNEFENGENAPTRILHERVWETAYLWHNYQHPTIGSRSDIEGVPIERLQAFYKKYYQPDNAVLIVGGKIDEAKTLSVIQQKFGAIPRPTRVLSEPYTAEPAQDGEREVSLRRAGDVQAVIAAYHIPSAGHPDTVALELLAQVLSDPAEGRLRKRLVDTKLASNAMASAEGLHDAGMIDFTAVVPKDGNLTAAREELIRISQGVPAEPITQADLDRVRARSLHQYEELLSDSNITSMVLAEAVAKGDWRLIFWDRDETRKVTLSDVQRVAQQYLVPSNLTVGTFIPDQKPVRATIPSNPDYAERFKNYKGQGAVAAGEQFDPTPANIEARTTRSAIGGIKLALLPKKTRANVVNAVFQVHFGEEKSLGYRTTVGSTTAGLLMRGTAKHTMQQLRDALTANKTEMYVSGGATGVNVFLRSDREHVAEALRLVAEVLREPSFPQKEFDAYQQAVLTGLEQRRTDPAGIANLALQRALSPYPAGHVRYVPTLDESIVRQKATSLEDVKKFYREFYGVGAAEIAVVGDFDEKQTTQLVRTLFADWKSPAAYRRVPDLFKPVAGQNQSFNTPDKPNAVFAAGASLQIRDDDTAFPGLVLGNYMLGGGFLNSRLATRIRQKEGLSYGVGSSVSAGALDRVGSFSAGAICAPQNYAKVVKAFEEELARAIKEGFTVDEVAAAKSGFLQAEKVSRADDGALAGLLADHLFEGRTLQWDEQFEKKIGALTPSEIAEAMRQYIDPSHLVLMGAGDFAKGK